MTNEEPITLFDDLSGGVITNVAKGLAPKNSVAVAINFMFDKEIGAAVSRPGTTRLGGQIVDNTTCLGLFQFITSAGVKTLFSVFDDAASPTNADVYIFNGSAWAKSSEDITKSLKVRSVSFLNTLAIFNGTDANRAYTTSWATTGGNLDIANMPKFKYGVEWHDRIYGAGVSANPDRLYYSSIPTGGVISWTVGNGYIDIEPDVGEAITALAKVPGYLLIFKERTLKRWDGNSTYPDDLINIGTPSQESVCYGRGMCFFFNYKGIFATNGGYPVKISRPVQKFIDAIPASYYDDVSAMCDEESARFSIGDVTVDSETYNNVVLKYNIDDKTWEVWCYEHEFRFFTRYIDASSNVEYVGGDTDGQVLQLDYGYTDYSGKPIELGLATHELDFGTKRIKLLTELILETRDAEGGRVMARVNKGDWDEIGGIDAEIIQMKQLNLRFNYLELEIVDMQGSTQSRVISAEVPIGALEVTNEYA